MGAEEVPSVLSSSVTMDSAELSDRDSVYAVRKALASVQNVSIAHMLLLPHTYMTSVSVCVRAIFCNDLVLYKYFFLFSFFFLNPGGF